MSDLNDGKGIYTFANDASYNGYWTDDELNGLFMITTNVKIDIEILFMWQSIYYRARS